MPPLVAPVPPYVRTLPAPIFRPPPSLPGQRPASELGQASDPVYRPPAPPDYASMSDDDVTRSALRAAGWDDASVELYIRNLKAQQAAFVASSGFASRQLQSQIDDAEKMRANAWRIAKYQTDTQSQTAAKQLAAQAAQFQQTHGLEVAKAFVQFAQTPDMMFVHNDSVSALGNVSQGRSPSPAMSQGQPHAKTWDDFAALSGYGGSGGTAHGGAGGKGGSGDERHKAVKAVMQAIPPSDGPGHDGQDWEALNAIQSLYAAGLPGSVARLGPARQKIANAGLARLGYDVGAVNDDYQRALPHQHAARAA